MKQISPLVSTILGRNGVLILKLKCQALTPSRPNERKRNAWRDLFQTYKSYFPTKKPPSSHLVVYFVDYPLQVRDCHSVVCHWDIFFFAFFYPIHHTCAVKHT